jgi:hypothetical protein
VGSPGLALIVADGPLCKALRSSMVIVTPGSGSYEA